MGFLRRRLRPDAGPASSGLTSSGLTSAGLAAVVLAAGLVGGPAEAAPATAAPATRMGPALPAPMGKAELDRLRTDLAMATAEAQRLAEEVFVSAARSAHLRRAMDQLADAQDLAQDALDNRIRSLYMRGRSDPIAAFVARMNNPDLAYLAKRSGLSSLQSDAALVAGATSDSAEATALRAQAEEVRRDLLTRAGPVLAAQDRARALLSAAEAAVAADAAAAAELAARRATLDSVSRSLAFAVAPAVTARGRRAAAAEAPVVALIEQHCCSSLPPGFRPTGRVITGLASWYGPGFVGNPTATGAPYDPERLTAAMLAVPLGTVVRVSTDDGLAIVVLINDRGPYVDGRVIDLSRAGSRLLGFSGVKKVTVEILEAG